MEGDMDAELRHHMERFIEEQIRFGMPRAQAERLARLDILGERVDRVGRSFQLGDDEQLHSRTPLPRVNPVAGATQARDEQ